MINVVNHGYSRDVYFADNPKGTILFSHGAGAGNKHDFIVAVSEGLSKAGYNVVALNFPYMQLAYELDKRRPPNKVPSLIDHVEQELTWISEQTDLCPPIFLLGKSMGGRVSTMVDAQCSSSETKSKISGIIVYGYPFMPPGKPEKIVERMAHFEAMSCPTLIIQGERDTFGNCTTLKDIKLQEHIKLSWLNDGDHSFKPRKSSGTTESANIVTAIDLTLKFMEEQHAD